MSLIDLISPIGRLLRARGSDPAWVAFLAPESRDLSGEWTHETSASSTDEESLDGGQERVRETRESGALVLSIVSILLITVGVLAHAN